MALKVIYYSTKSENTHRFIQKLECESFRLPVKTGEVPVIDFPYVLAFPTYGGGYLEGAIPPVVKDFLNTPENRNLLRGVIGLGNTNFGNAFCLGGRLVASKCNVPMLREVEIMGTVDDVVAVNDAINQLKGKVNV